MNSSLAFRVTDVSSHTLLCSCFIACDTIHSWDLLFPSDKITATAFWRKTTPTLFPVTNDYDAALLFFSPPPCLPWQLMILGLPLLLHGMAGCQDVCEENGGGWLDVHWSIVEWTFFVLGEMDEWESIYMCERLPADCRGFFLLLLLFLAKFSGCVCFLAGSSVSGGASALVLLANLNRRELEACTSTCSCKYALFTRNRSRVCFGPYGLSRLHRSGYDCTNSEQTPCCFERIYGY